MWFQNFCHSPKRIIVFSLIAHHKIKGPSQWTGGPIMRLEVTEWAEGPTTGLDLP